MTRQRIKELKGKLKEVGFGYSDEAINAVNGVLDRITDEDDEIMDLLINEVDNAVICYSDCFDYLRETHCYDFTEAINEGFGKSITSIVYYYLEKECLELLRELKVW